MAEGDPSCVYLSVSFAVPPSLSPPLPLSLSPIIIIIKDFSTRQKPWPPERQGFRFGFLCLYSATWAPLVCSTSEHSSLLCQTLITSLVLPQVCCTHNKGWHCCSCHYCSSLSAQLGVFSLPPPWPQLVPSRTPLGVSPESPAQGSRGCGRSGLGWGPQLPGTHC